LSYKSLCYKVKSLEEQLQGIRETEEKPKPQKLSDMPKAHRQSDLSDIMVKEEVLFTNILIARNECMNRRLEIEDVILRIPEGKESMVVRKKYLEYKGWEQIAEEVDCSNRNVHRIHSKALKIIVDMSLFGTLISDKV